MDLIQNILRIDLDDPSFEIRTPLVKMLKKENMHLYSGKGLFFISHYSTPKAFRAPNARTHGFQMHYLTMVDE